MYGILFLYVFNFPDVITSYYSFCCPLYSKHTNGLHLCTHVHVNLLGG